jgi:hypothetical protein
MANIRKAKKSKYSSIGNHLLQDDSLSFACRGMLGYLLSRPDNWQCRVSDIEKQGNMGAKARRSIMVEAEKAGYLTYQIERGERGRLNIFYTVHEEPVEESLRTKSWTYGTETGQKAQSTTPPSSRGGQSKGGSSKGGQRGGLIITELINTELNKTDLEKHPAPNGAMLPDSSPSPHSRLMAFLSTECGKYTDGGRQGKAVKWLLDNGFTPDQCEACLKDLLTQQWRNTRPSWLTVQNEIAFWLKKHPNFETPADQEAKQKKQAWFAEVRATLGCEVCKTSKGKPGEFPFGKGYVAYPYGPGDAPPCPGCNPRHEAHPHHPKYLEMTA